MVQEDLDTTRAFPQVDAQKLANKSEFQILLDRHFKERYHGLITSPTWGYHTVLKTELPIHTSTSPSFIHIFLPDSSLLSSF